MSQDPYALENLLPAGTVLLHVQPDAARPIIPAPTVGDDWGTLLHFLGAHSLQLEISSQLRLNELEFLIHHRFVRATWRILDRDDLHFHLRVYLIPFDLPGVCGCLAARNRSEAKLLVPARKALTSILKVTNRSASAWTGYPALDGISEPFIPQEHDERTLSEIYGDLPSPVIDPSTFLSGAAPMTRAALKDALTWEAPSGMVPLYAYQRRTVARMLQQELDPGLAPDPLYIPISGVGGTKIFYLQPSSMEVLRELPMRSQAKGGILCEEMGTGKTCIVLALIMATKQQISAPEDTQTWDAPERPVLTPLAFHHFPQFGSARSAARFRPQEKPNSLPSLVETLGHFIRASPEGIWPPSCEADMQEKCPHLWKMLMRNHPFYHIYMHALEMCSPRRKGRNPGPRKVYLTSATLVIVPRAIFEQWDAEINKHCQSGSLRVYRVKTSEIPPAPELASEYDVILMTHERFAAEKARCDTTMLHSWTQCKCELDECEKGALLPICKCDRLDSVSPLIQIRWKRLVIDEGHASATQSNLALLAQELNVERRWIVSGTPTRNLMGLSLGQSGDLMQVDVLSDEEDLASEHDDEQALSYRELLYPSDCTDEEDSSGREYDDGAALSLGTDSSHKQHGFLGQKNSPQHVRRWTAMDRQDLNKLGDMITKFIGVPQFAHETAMFRKSVIAPLLDRGGPSFGAIQVVGQVMRQIMIRHQIRDVERELPEKLPPLKEKTVALKFQPLAAKTYNVLQSLIAVNAVDSERKDQDYLFHPTQTRRLRETLENLSQTMFWRTDQNLFDIDEAVKRAENALAVALGRNLPASDIKLVEDSLRVLCNARDDPLWRGVMHHDDNPFIVHNLSPALRTVWLKLDPSLFENNDCLLSSDRLCKLRQILANSPLISEQRLVEHGFHVDAEDKQNALKYESYLRSLKRKRRQDDDIVENSKLWQINAKTGSKEAQRELIQEFSAAVDRRNRGETIGPASSAFESFPNAPPLFASRSSFTALRVGNSLSAKVNYILRKVLKHAAKRKFLIFSASPLSLAYVTEALQVVQVPCLQYTSRVPSRVRQQMVVTFETSDRYRVLLMELKLGARGLNLVTASRIIFCEPVWQGDIESQAIKRAHRIGQKADEIKVSTLVMQGTSEEVMVTRRHALQRKSQQLPNMDQDVGMRRFIQNPTFTEAESVQSTDLPDLDIALVPCLASRPFSQAEASPQAPGNLETEIDLELGSDSKLAQGSGALLGDGPTPVKARKLVHFG